MAIDNLISVSFTDDELNEIDGHIAALETIFKNKGATLLPEQRREYGKLGNRTENWARKVSEYMDNQPSLTPLFIDTAETGRDVEARKVLLPRFNRLTSVLNIIDDTLLILGADIYNTSLSYYRNIKLLAKQNVAGAKAIYDDLSAQFPGRPNSETSDNAASTTASKS